MIMGSCSWYMDIRVGGMCSIHKQNSHREKERERKKEREGQLDSMVMHLTSPILALICISR